MNLTPMVNVNVRAIALGAAALAIGLFLIVLSAVLDERECVTISVLQ